MKKGICILVESPDGAGKDTLIENIAKTHPEMDFKIYKFPSGEFRTQIFEKPRTQAELYPIFCQNFKDSLDSLKKDLAEGKNIIINRMYISTLIYSVENNVPAAPVLYDIEQSIGDWRPDLTVIIDIDPQESFKRLSSRNDEKNWLDGDFDKQIRINQLYKDFITIDWNKLYKTNKNILVVNGNGSREEVINDFNSKFKTWIKQNRPLKH